MTALYPLRLTPIYKDYLWGGTKLGRVLGRTLEPGKAYAESWEVADLEVGQSIVGEGPLAGVSLHELVVDRGKELLGRHRPQPRFPLLLKYLDANKRLSVQVHPNDALAARMGLSDPGKSEAWVVLQADSESRIWAGFNRPVDRETLREAVAGGKVERVLDRFHPEPGQCLLLPAGTVHALGEGVLVAEIQQNSDATFRLFDWNRVGPNGKPRALHVEEALEATDYRQRSVRPQRPRSTDRPHVERLVQSDKFILDRWRISSSQEAGGDDGCHILTVLEGAVTLAGDPCQRPLGLGQTVLIPASAGAISVTPHENAPATLLDAYLP
ncbi:MAG: type I phosphomannose isomerase catalytic subunit [Planctomycetota bacterium]|jgi:mannose-6-phosphate isomerase